MYCETKQYIFPPNNYVWIVERAGINNLSTCAEYIWHDTTPGFNNLKLTVIIDLIKDSHTLSTVSLVHFVRTCPSVVGKLQQTRGAKYRIKMVKNSQQRSNIMPNGSPSPGEEGCHNDATRKDDGFIMSLNGKHNISPGGRSARHNSSSKDVKKPTKVTPYAKLTSLAVAAGQTSTKASRGVTNVVTVKKNTVPRLSTPSAVFSEPVPDPKLESIVKKLEFTDEESKHKMLSWAESSDDEDDDGDEDFDAAEETDADVEEHQSTYFSTTRGMGRGGGYGNSGRGHAGRGRGAEDRLASSRSQDSLDLSSEEEWNDVNDNSESSESSASSKDEVGQPAKQNSSNIVINDSDEGRSMLEMNTSMISEIEDEPSVYPSTHLTRWMIPWTRTTKTTLMHY